MRTYDITPSAHRLTSSLRDIGHDLTTALADLLDNSIDAGAWRIDVELVFEGGDSYIVVADDGSGMTAGSLDEALRFGSRRDYERGELGRYGLGLKTATLSQGRRLTVVSRHAPQNRRIAARALDLDRLERTDRWEVVEPQGGRALEVADEWLTDGPGTVVVMEKLDRILPDSSAQNGWGRRRLTLLAQRAREYLGMVFHRFIEGECDHPVVISVNGEKVEPWNPFAPGEEHRQALPRKRFEVETPGSSWPGEVWFAPFVLPARKEFSSPDEFERLSGPGKWNKQQGLYVYRSGRMIQSGGWSGLRAADEHTKLARAALDFDTDLDEAFRINVAKMRVTLPPQLRDLLKHPVQELCNRSNAAYRRDSLSSRGNGSSRNREAATASSAREFSAALTAAAAEAGEFDAWMRILDALGRTDPELARAIVG